MTDDIRAYAKRALPPLDGTLHVAGLRDRVEVIRDRWGVPSIYASNLEDLYFAQGFVIAQDRLFGMESVVRYTLGRSAEIMGPDVLPTDRWIRTLGFHRLAETLADDLDDLSVLMGTSYLRGAHAWIEQMPCRPVEYEILGVDPWLPAPEDGPAVLAAAWMVPSFHGEHDAELVRTWVLDAVGVDGYLELFPSIAGEPNVVAAGKRPAYPDELRTALQVPKPGEGSNNWVVSGARTASGKPLLANDPHQTFMTPQLFYECHLCAPGIDVRGNTFAHMPGIVLGHTPTYGWAITAVLGDQTDLFVERLNDDGTAALYDGTWEQLSVRTETIGVRGDEDVEITVRSTRNGPLLESPPPGHTEVPKELYSLRWAGLEGAPHRVSSTHRMSTATDVHSFYEAFRDWPANAVNVLYAGTDGTIGYHIAGAFPKRRKGDGTLPLPGWDPACGWDGLIAFDELPQTMNPDVGFMVTANARTYDDSYPYSLGEDHIAPYRTRRATQLVTRTDKHTVETFRAIQADTVSLQALEALPRMLEAESSEHHEALKLLREWDGDLRADSAAACLYQVWLRKLLLRILSPALGERVALAYLARRGPQHLPHLLTYPTSRWFGENGIEARDAVLISSLTEAIDHLREALGDDMMLWRWGDLHKIKLVHNVGGNLREHEDFFTAGVIPHGGDAYTVNPGAYLPENYVSVAGACWRQIIDLSDPDASIGVGLTGQSSNPASPHFADQVELRFADEYRPLPLSRERIESIAANTLILEP